MKTRKVNRIYRAFTLVELMAVVIIIGLIAAIAAKNFFGQTEVARVTTTKATMGNLHDAVNLFKMQTGRYPTEEEGLMALIERPSDVESWPDGGYLKGTTLPRDAWKHDFIYQLNPESGKPFVIISLGADGKEGGEDKDVDLFSTDTE
jgi:general secretion pathway protein G